MHQAITHAMDNFPGNNHVPSQKSRSKKKLDTIPR